MQRIRPSPRTFVTYRNKLIFLRWGVVSPAPKTKAGRSPLVGCPRLFSQYIRSYLSYLEADSSNRNLKTRHAVVTSDPLNMFNYVVQNAEVEMCTLFLILFISLSFWFITNYPIAFFANLHIPLDLTIIYFRKKLIVLNTITLWVPHCREQKLLHIHHIRKCIKQNI
jgi:hypothetical protein